MNVVQCEKMGLLPCAGNKGSALCTRSNQDFLCSLIHSKESIIQSVSDKDSDHTVCRLVHSGVRYDECMYTPNLHL